MSKLKKLLPKQDLRARWLWVLALALTAVKLGLCSFQLIVASPDLSPIDDTLMFNLAKSISAGTGWENTIGSRWASIRFMRSGWRF